MDSLLFNFTSKYDLIILDAPPILSFAYAQHLANKCDGTILVINSGKTDKVMAINAKEAIEFSNYRSRSE